VAHQGDYRPEDHLGVRLETTVDHLGVIMEVLHLQDLYVTVALFQPQCNGTVCQMCGTTRIGIGCINNHGLLIFVSAELSPGDAASFVDMSNQP